jgi:hypothetical protein
MPSRFEHRRKPKPPPMPEGFCSLDIHLAALARPCPQCGGRMYRDEWGEFDWGDKRNTRLHSCVECGYEREVKRRGKPLGADDESRRELPQSARGVTSVAQPAVATGEQVGASSLSSPSPRHRERI